MQIRLTFPAALLAASALAFGLAFGVAWAPAAAQDCPAPPENDTIDFGGVEPLEIVTASGRYAFEVQIADTREELSRGLMFRPEIAPTFGMLFKYDAPQQVSFYMRNTCASLDIIFVKADGRIDSLVRHAVPFSERSLPSAGRVTGVLEIAAGRAADLDVHPGDLIVHPFFGAAPESGGGSGAVEPGDGPEEEGAEAP